MLEEVLATRARLPSGLTAIPVGFCPTGIVAITVFVAASMTETVPPVASRLVTYTRLPSGLTLTPKGAKPTGMVATMVLVLRSMTDTSFDTLLGIYAKPEAMSGAAVLCRQKMKSPEVRLAMLKL